MDSMNTNQTGSSVSGLTRNEQILIAHVVLSLIPCLITIPLGIFIARFLRKIIPSAWFHLHWILQVVFSTIPTIVGFVIVHHFMEKSHFNWADVPHSAVGHVLTFAIVFEVIFGALYTTKCHVNKLRIVHKLLYTYSCASRNCAWYYSMGSVKYLALSFLCMDCAASFNLFDC
ncbi:12751_t:CDS:2 [Cetraspora pellucida]|uniref:12751_t:CDS:1 n=1 Tax=Cetraspora pellucida TaxID=1433469 RepID=A0A9N9HHB3_9GLOM|nr:12751_t:CDS:2 [Cetraspora pellucida]